MAMKLEFKSIYNQGIFQPEFQNLDSSEYGTIEFKKQPHASGGIAVVYAPNGTGKSSLTNVLGAEESTEAFKFEAVYNESTVIVPEEKAFHIIGDQISRNVIKGETSDYLIGREIRREYDLKKKIFGESKEAFNNLNIIYKKEYNVTKVTDYMIKVIQSRNPVLCDYITDIVNRKFKGNNIDLAEFIPYLHNNENQFDTIAVESEKKQFVINNMKLVEKLLEVVIDKIVVNAEIRTIEQNDDAINILTKYEQMHSCIVCDNDDIDSESLLQQKTENRKRIVESLDTTTKELLEKAAMNQILLKNDPFNIKSVVLKFLTEGEMEDMQELQSQLQLYINAIADEMCKNLLNVFSNTAMYAWWNEYTHLLGAQPELDSEELVYIEKIISENIGREIKLVRDAANDHNFKLMLDDQELLGLERNEMHLSTGEQNFISLAFALLLARHSNQEFVVLDDPISSFDSVYKNKIAFCIIKFLENKKQIILTHNTDLIRLLEVQLQDCFKLYILNNVEGGKNSFIPVKNEEKKILINMADLIKLFQNKDNSLEDIIVNKRQFLMAMIPFMRGYAHIMKDPDDYYGELSKLMHGYEEKSVDVAKIYRELFGYSVEDTEIVAVEDILNLSFTEINIIDDVKYPLLADTLKQTLIYYHIRMKVEHDLMKIFTIQYNENDILMLTNIIQKAFRTQAGTTKEEKNKMRDNRVFFTSRKTLLNEFNHFEGNMNIFQPAIDITENALNKEIQDIERELAELREEYEQ